MSKNPRGKAEELRLRLDREAGASGYNLNPDLDVTSLLCAGLVKNEGRYGYMSCPCRLASGKREEDRDIICPCDYRDADLAEYGACYCALYVSDAIAAGKKEAVPIPERRLPDEQRHEAPLDIKSAPAVKSGAGGGVTPPPGYPPTEDLSKKSPALGRQPGDGVKVWRCKVCGYLCAKETPPLRCPICKADKDRFEGFAM
ncbi:MAG: hypothetical protein A2X34_09965 [Elusimicrobia bacterium GWC2_51_8]|nr:MAG: hypothetical protein A2X33_06925 [Elusimicrobia bacterium GWA2_51_34]OGR58225.1 MAG: hypothetical protein A2X34_09965 [Elusimicrobia bacterium GWC2_51_8]OGR88578.1 MAG: hypothetical protein A2021_09910 [Elusimicrobia bacterium GWF2_52_66]HAF95460.1 ferredoxin:glutaredoxin reductase [Elusimicrobiota bacterium]HCE98122.1 ferredoxin:glutaredoxin reductase [Elusimicrobiota bacterium]